MTIKDRYLPKEGDRFDALSTNRNFYRRMHICGPFTCKGVSSHGWVYGDNDDGVPFSFPPCQWKFFKRVA